jgi:hypothetical protein
MPAPTSRAPRLQPRRPLWLVVRHMQRVAAPLQIAGHDIVGVQLPPGFDRVRGGSRDPPADDAPQRRAACGVPRFLADALGQGLVLRLSGYVGERENRDGRHAEWRCLSRSRRGGHSRRGFNRHQIPCGCGRHGYEHRERGGDRSKPALRRRFRLGGGLADLDRINRRCHAGSGLATSLVAR